MARDLSKLTNKIDEVAKKSFEKANEKKVTWIADENLLDHPLNDEDLSYTEDIEEHIRTEGFRYPLIITKYGCPDKEKYYIVSGHRSRRAGRNLGKTQFPCVIEDYASETEVYHAILSGNARRNRDPLDLANRYLKWDKYLDMTDFKGNRAEKIGKCLGISGKQAEKYKAFTKIIPEFWQLVREREAAKDGLYQLAPKTPEEQKQIYDFFLICNPENSTLTVSLERNIINAWRQGARTYEQYKEWTALAAAAGAKTAKSTSIYKEDNTIISEIPKEAEREQKHDESISEGVGSTVREINGHNDNESAIREFKEIENRKYADERLTEEDKENAARPAVKEKEAQKQSNVSMEPKEHIDTNVKRQDRTAGEDNTGDEDKKAGDINFLVILSENQQKRLSYLLNKFRLWYDENYDDIQDGETSLKELYTMISGLADNK